MSKGENTCVADVDLDSEYNNRVDEHLGNQTLARRVPNGCVDDPAADKEQIRG